MQTDAQKQTLECIWANSISVSIWRWELIRVLGLKERKANVKAQKLTLCFKFPEVVLNKHQPSSPHLKKENVSIYVFSHYQVCCLVKCLFRRPPCSSRSLLSPELLSGGDRCMKTVHNAIRLCSIHTLMRIRIAMILIIQHFSSSRKSVFNIIVKSKQSHFYLFIWPT